MAKSIFLRKGPNGLLIPADDEAGEKLGKYRVGAVIRAEVKEAHNYAFLRKMHALFKLSYDHFVEYGVGVQTYKGQAVVPDYDRFRKDLTILSGHYTPVFRIDGTVRLEAKSISYDKASNEDREKIFSDVLNVALDRVYKGEMSEQQLRYLVEQYVGFMH